jgi:murein DD-endopeptidase MepM/ murein hydrolase activator NlpD
MKSPRYTILIASRKSGAVRRLTFSRRLALTTAGFACAMPVLIGLGWSGASVTEVENLRSANEALRLENESYREATGELTSQIASLQTALVQLGEQGALDANTRAAMAVINRARGVGGPVTISVPPAPPIKRAPEAPETTFGILRDLLGSIESRLTSVRSQVDTQQSMARVTPSVWPVSGWLSSLYGNRKDPFTGLPDFHPAIDIATERGREVRATADGTIESVGYLGNYGNQILVNHGFGVATRYGHLSGFNVRQGQKVKKNDIIGYVGSTGRATSPHLHYEIIINGQTINPLRLLTGNR